MCGLESVTSRLSPRMLTAIVRSEPPFPDLALALDPLLDREALVPAVETDFEFAEASARRRAAPVAADSMKGWAFVGIQMAIDRRHWGWSVEDLRSLWVVQVELRRRGCVFGRTGYSRLRIVVETL